MSLLHGAELDVVVVTQPRAELVVGGFLLPGLLGDGALAGSLPLQLSQPRSRSLQLNGFLFNLINYFIKGKFSRDSIALPLVLKAHSHPLVVKDYVVGLD